MVMMNRKLTAECLILCMALAAACADFRIVLDKDASRQERTAALELREHLEKASGHNVTVAGSPAAGERNIILGRAAKGIDFSGFGPEEYLIKANGPDELVIGGGVPRGTLYGVFEFCERELGIAWLDPDCTYIPFRPDYAWKLDLKISGKPAFSFRNAEPYVGTNPGGKVSRYMLRNRNNSLIYIKYEGLPADYGVFRECGSPGSSHTFSSYTAGWGKAESEAMALYQGKRIVSRGGLKPGQVCFTSPLARRLFTASLRKYIESDRSGKPRDQWPTIYEISQNDTLWGWCECPACRAAVGKYGGWSGALLDFINSTADGIAADYPEVRIRTLAYGRTLEPPEHIKPAPNVIVRYANTSAEIGSVIWNGRDRDSMRPFLHPNNSMPRKLMEKWAASGSKLAVWDYWCLYGGKGKWPTVNVKTIAENIRFYHSLGAEMLLAESANVDLTSFHPLRIWIGNRAMNHPDMDYEKELDIFFAGYYGPAAKPMRMLLEHLQAANDAVPGAIGVLAVKDRPDFTPDFFRRADELLNAAEKAAGNNADILFRIHREHAPFDRARLDLIDIMPMAEAKKELVLGRYEKYHKSLCTPQYMGTVRGPKMISDIDAYVSGIRRLSRTKPLPELGKRKIIAEFLWKDFTLLGEGSHTLTVYDPEAAGETCIAVDGTLIFFGGGSLRSGIYDPIARKSLASLIIPRPKLPQDEKFHLYYLGKVKLSPHSFFWAHPSWGIALNLSCVYGRTGKNHEADVYFSTKVQGPDYVPGSRNRTLYKFDRLVFAEPES